MEGKENDEAKADSIDNIALFNEGDRYGLAGGKFIVRYDGKDTVVPLTPDTDDENVYFADKAVYVSDGVTGVAYGDAAEPESPVMVLMGRDKGKTWDSFKVPDTKAGDYEQKYMGFTTRDNGWLLLAGGTSTGHQQNRIFQTADGAERPVMR
jgi:hypothetical protein